jgi:hypothetical protein
MKTVQRALGSAVILFTAMPPVGAAAQADRLSPDMTARAARRQVSNLPHALWRPGI